MDGEDWYMEEVMRRKSIDLETVKSGKKKERELNIISVSREPIVEDFLPDYKLEYEGEEENTELKALIKTYNEFLKANSELVLNEYNSSNIKAIQEGFSRATAIAELFFKSMYIEEDGTDEV